MSTFRKTVLTTAIIGAGLAATSGSAFASDHHESHDSKSASVGCSNLVQAANENGAGEVTRGDVTGGGQDIVSENICNNLNGNTVMSGNNLAGRDLQNGSNSVESNSTSTASAEGRNAQASILSGLL